ncbi:hypothetical protein BDN72DRAFT_779372 [Pluteus cervinus]|uniref:Uncharacterized protein n=1 Tax=Pluteus cervinus TaxID=181527 RepID=A0ACD3A4X6_9AGAR|nr:hypothetical protein BDN72DRAFT_779372 [Pluteus cervinus]
MNVFHQPTLFVDQEDRVMAWYLPEILTKKRQNEIIDKTTSIEDVLKKSIKGGKDWRTDSKYFLKRGVGGCINVSPAWFQQGRNLHLNDPEVSLLLKQSTSVQRWVQDMQSTFEVVNAMSRILHPKQHEIGRSAINRLRKTPTILKDPVAGKLGLLHWTTVFSAIAVILNRSCPYHRDAQSATEGLDLMLTVGEYDGAFMQLQPLNVQLLYNPGTVVALSGPLVRHRVSCHKPGRLCLAFYMREAVHQKVGCTRIPWMSAYGS